MIVLPSLITTLSVVLLVTRTRNLTRIHSHSFMSNIAPHKTQIAHVVALRTLLTPRSCSSIRLYTRKSPCLHVLYYNQDHNSPSDRLRSFNGDDSNSVYQGYGEPAYPSLYSSKPTSIPIILPFQCQLSSVYPTVIHRRIVTDDLSNPELYLQVSIRPLIPSLPSSPHVCPSLRSYRLHFLQRLAARVA